MGIELAIGGFLLGTAYSINQQDKARFASKQRRDEQRAGNAASFAAERRAQIREERVKRAQVLQASDNTGITDSSGMFGAVSALDTNLTSNIGQNAGKQMYSSNISMFEQKAADALFQASLGKQLADISVMGAQMVNKTPKGTK